jgi:hypothetical protein
MPTLVLHLGVIDQPYADPAPAPRKAPKDSRRASKRPRGAKPAATPNQTTGDVAKILEERYDVMAGFMLLHGQDVADDLADAMVGALEDLLAGAPPAALADPLAPAAEKIGERFREFIDLEELSGLEEGVPTAAALKGVSHRFKHPYAQGHPRRPSFVDTGLYRESFIAWTDSH